MTGDLQILPGWTLQAIGDIGEIVTGKTPSTKVPGHFDGDIPFITPSDMDGRRIISNTARYVTNKGAATVSSSRIPKGAVMVSCIGSDMGKAAIAGSDAITNQQINSIVVHEGICSLYVYYDLSARQREIQYAGAGGSAVPILNKGHFCQLPIMLPPIKQRQAIACILGSLDDKIELNRKMNQTLEEMARAIFKSWFVDFDPVRAKAAGQQPNGLKPDIAALFPDSFEDSELGEIPKGWRVGILGDLVDNVVDRISPSVSTESHPYVPIECIEARSVCLANWQPGNNARSSLIKFRKGDILFGAMRPYFHKVCVAPFDGTTRTTAFVLRPAVPELAFSAFAISRDETIDYATAHSEGSTIPYAKWAGSLQSMRHIIPPQNARQAFHNSVWPFIERMIANIWANTMLTSLRDALLPKLLSGELRVPDAERIVERCM